MLGRLPALVRFLLAVTAINVAVFAAFRVVFWAAFHEASASASWADILRALYLGLKFDLRLALLLGLPLALLGWIPVFNPARRSAARIAWLGYLALAQCVVLLLYFVDFGHYSYVRARLNASLADHLTPVAVAARVAWETYPILPGVLGLLLLVSGYAWLVRRAARSALAPVTDPLGKWPRRAAVGALAALYLLGIYGKWSWYPLRWSEAYFSSSEAVAALALNPVLFLADTAANASRPYDTSKVREHYPYMASLLGIKAPDPQNLVFARYVTPRNRPAIKYNLVVIHLESFAAFKAGVFGNRLDATPQFDAIAREGILFTNFFVPEVPTARSVFTMMTGIPDVSPNTTASRNPLVVNQHTLVNALEGYAKYYFLGGSATWGNIRGLFAHNVPGLQIYEEGDYDAPQADGWGVSDVVLFEKALEVLDKEKKPFFAFIQTAGNHRPYTIPEDRRGFELRQVDGAALKENGFDSPAAYNGLRYLDYSLETFFSRARRAAYFQNTVFVMYGDHGNPSNQPTSWEQLRLTGFHVPLVIYAPGLIQGARRIDFAASLTDSLPTALGLLGIPYVNTGLGRDLLSLAPNDPHYSLIDRNGVLDDQFYMRLDPGGARLFRYRSQAALEDVSGQYPEKLAELERLHEALYETSKYLLYHNPARAHAPEGSLVGQAAAR
jgi:phosphoglycerol transferase MdoB-like AlkP superfamily enzyme